MEGIVRLRLLGTVQVERDGEPVRGFGSRKALALLGYLAVQGQPVPRERLADLFWGDRPEVQGRANLSWVLHRLSSLLPDCLQADRHSLRFQPQAPYWLDLDAFEELRAQGDPGSLAAAVELARGEFLEGLYLQGCAEFELWLVAERERWRQRVASALETLVAHHTHPAGHDEALYFARRLLALEPWREGAHQQVMRLYAWSGQRGAALAQYKACRQALAEELGVEPGVETTRLYERIRDGTLEASVLPASPSLILPAQPPSFFEAERAAAERPVFVGRERELAQLNGFLDTALHGQGRVVFVTGSAGRGKTALIREFARQAQSVHADLVVADGNANAPTGIGDPYLPFRQTLGLLSGDVKARWDARAMGREQARRLWRLLPLTVQALVEVGPDLVETFLPGASLLRRGMAFAPAGAEWLARLEPRVERKAAVPGDPNLQQRALFEQYMQVLRALASRRPLLLLLDDLQWADAGSISLLFHLGRQLAGSRILILGAYRPAEVLLGRPSTSPGQRERHPLVPVVNELKRELGDIEVALGQDDGRRFVEAFLDTEPNHLGAAFREILCRQTDGHPLFTVELLRGMQERGDLVQDGEGRWVEGPDLDWETLPARVEAVIAERVGRLPPRLQQILAVASVEGETFTAEVVAQVRTADEVEMVHWLSADLGRWHHLVNAQGVQQIGNASLCQYRFRHILFQRYLYNSLDAVERAHLHRAVGTALEVLCHARPDESAGITEIAPQLAWHFQEGGIPEKAVAYLLQAGKRAARLSAHQEAIVHLSHGLELLEALPDSSARALQDLALLIALVVSLQATKGYAAPEVGCSCARARELCRQVDETPQLFPVLWMLASFHIVRGEYHTANEMGGQLLNLAEHAGDPALVVLNHVILGWTTLFLGELPVARAHLERVAALYDPRQHHALAFLYGQDPGAICLSWLSSALWLLGYPEQALKRSREAIALAQELSHPHSLAVVYGLGSVFQTLQRDAQMAQEWGEVCVRITFEHGFPFFLAVGAFCRGWALTRQGQAVEGIAQMYQGIADVRATGSGAGLVHQLVMLASAYGETEQIEEGLTTLAEALEVVELYDERFCEAEIHRLKGELLWMQGEVAAEVERHYWRAIEVARRQHARSWELRATMSLCRLWQKQGKREEARRMLAEIYGWFSEGFDTADLKEAKALLAELS